MVTHTADYVINGSSYFLSDGSLDIQLYVKAHLEHVSHLAELSFYGSHFPRYSRIDLKPERNLYIP